MTKVFFKKGQEIDTTGFSNIVIIIITILIGAIILYLAGRFINVGP